MNSLVHWDPFKELNRFSNFIGSEKPELAKGEGRDWAPAVDIAEDDDAFTITADLPDVKKEDVSVSVQNGYLTIAGERSLKKEEHDSTKKYHRIERRYGSYSRSFSLPENVDGDGVKAKFKDGVLSVILPKVATDQAAGKVEVEVD